jgi:hypothetical protein
MVKTITALALLTFAFAVVLPRFTPEAGAQQFAQAEKKKKGKKSYSEKQGKSYKNPMKQ